MWIVTLRKTDLITRRWEHDSEDGAYRRAKSLADLHSRGEFPSIEPSPSEGIEGGYMVDAREYYKPSTVKCSDCGVMGETAGHMECQYPEDH